MRVRLILLAVAAVAAAACATVRDVYLHPLADPAAYRKIAVLPFENLSGYGQGAHIVEEGFLLALLRYGTFEVVDPGEVRAAVEAARIQPGRTDRDSLKALRERLGVDAVLTGAVVIFDASAPEVNVTARLIEVDGGSVVWAAEMGSVGRTDLPTFGIGETTSVRRLAHRVVTNMVRTLLQPAGRESPANRTAPAADAGAGAGE